MAINLEKAISTISSIIPKDVLWIIDELEKNGFEGYAVGGCVRDSILNLKPKDWDITTSAKPEDVKRIFKKTIDTGLKHGTVTVRRSGESFEVTTYRIDGEYSDGRHPDNVIFTNSLLEDLKRRDFTINAMAYNPKTGIVDEFGGVEDLKNRIIRCVGNAKERFSEDALRILRAVRFAARFDFEIEEKTLKAMKELSENLSLISKERVYSELDKLLVSDHPEKIRVLYETGVTKVILPEFDEMMNTEQNSKYHDCNVGEHTIRVVCDIRNDHYLRWAALLHDVAKPGCKTTDENKQDHFFGHAAKGSQMATSILRGLKVDNKTIDIVQKLVYHHDDFTKAEDADIKSVRRCVGRVGNDIFPYLLELCKSDANGKAVYGRESSLNNISNIEKKYKKIIEDGDAFEIKDLKITGNDLIKLGMKPGKEIGNTLKMLLDMVLENPSVNTYEKLEEIVKNNMGKESK